MLLAVPVGLRAVLSLLLSCAATSIGATEVFYGEPTVLTGRLVLAPGRDCCHNGKEATVKFPAVRLSKPIVASSRPGTGPVAEEETEQDVQVVQLVLTSSTQWEAFNASKGQAARVSCQPFHSHTGHHFTKVLCSVSKIQPAAKPSPHAAQ